MNLNECHVSVFTFAYVYKIIYVIIYIYSYVCVYIYIYIYMCVCVVPQKNLCVCVCYYTTLAVGSASQVDLRWPCAATFERPKSCREPSQC